MSGPAPTRLAPRRRPPEADRKRGRAVAVAGTAALLAVGLAIILMITGASGGGGGGGGGDNGLAATGTRATPTPTATPTPKPKATPVPLTAAEKQQRAAAVQVVQSRGFHVVRLHDYDPRHTLRVLIGRTSSGSEMAFFFVGTDYIGNDSTSTSVRLTVRHSGPLAAKLRYATYQPGDAPDKPTGQPVDVTFRWDGVRLTPDTTPPDPAQRTPGLQTG